MKKKLLVLLILFGLLMPVCAFALNTIQKADFLTRTEAEGRFKWLEKCYPGLLVEVWDRMFDATTPVNDQTKIDELAELWVYSQMSPPVLKDTLKFLTFGDSNNLNPHNWFGSVSESDSCKVIPAEYGIIGLNTVLETPGQCDLVSQSNDYEHIAEIKIGNFTNASGANLYSDFRYKGISLRKGISYNIELTAGYSTPDHYDENWIIWIDLNGDGQFNHSNEYFFTGSGADKVTGTLTIPSSATSGPKTARIIMSFISNAYPCEQIQTIQFGEIEDYTIFVQ